LGRNKNERDTSFFFAWLLRSSWQAAILTVLVLLAQFCLGKRLDGRWRHLLWLLVLARLAIPFSPSSPASVFNYLRFDSPTTHRQTISTATFAEPPQQTIGVVATPIPALPSPPDNHWKVPPWPVLLAVIWAIGAAILGARVVVQNIIFRRRLRHGTAIDDPQISQP
jgi:beta-lactamase regulating signal transducer with metallopeptidase domain